MKMKVRIHGSRIPQELRELEVESWSGDLEGLIKKIVVDHPYYKEYLMDEKGVRRDLNILVNGRHCMFIDGLKTKIGTEDIIDILFPLVGG